MARKGKRSPLQVLVSLQDRDTASFLAGFLRRAGIAPRVAEPGEPLDLALREHRSFDAMILEVMDQGARGSLPELLRLHDGVPVVLQTESGFLDSAWAEGDWKPHAVLSKPLDLPLLMHVLKKAGVNPPRGGGKEDGREKRTG
jgi:DNA-binding NtrC family response regulator